MADQIFSVNAGFFDAVDYDRTYSAEDMTRPYSRIVADGVFATNYGDPSTDLQVSSAGVGMQIVVAAGQGIFAQKWFENPSAIAVEIPANTALFSRIDSVIVQVDKRLSGRVGNVIYRTGTASSAPVPPAINTVQNVVEYRIANITVGAGVNAIGNESIEDLRGTAACPWVTGLITQVDTSTLMQQYQAAYQAYYVKATQDFEEYTDDQRQAWEEFLKTLTDELTVTTNVIVYTSTFSATEEATNIPINIPSYNPNTDILQVFRNGLLMMEEQDYTINSNHTSVDLVGAITAGNDINFIVFKSIIGANIESAVSMMRRMDDEIQNFMDDSGWVRLVLENGATAYNADSVPSFRCVGNRMYLRGAVKGVTALNTSIAVLPVEYRPEKDHVFSTAAYDAIGALNDEITVTISAADGTIKLSSKSGEIDATDSIPLSTCYLSAFGNTVSLVYTFKGNVPNYASLPTEDVNAGDVYMVLSADPDHYIQAGDDVMWNGSGWEILQAVISSAEIDEIINSIS